MLIAKNSNPIPLFPPQIPHGLAWDWTRTSAVRGRRQTAWTLAPPLWILNCSSIYVHIDESALSFVCLGVREHCSFFTLCLWVRGVSGSGDEKLMSFASLESRNKTYSRPIKEHQAYVHSINRTTNLSLYHTVNVYGGTVVTWVQKYMQECHQFRARASSLLGGAVPCTSYLKGPQSRHEREFHSSTGKEHWVSVA
jgi:hypothetical protein